MDPTENMTEETPSTEESQSLDDRIAAKFGLDEADDIPDEQLQAETETQETPPDVEEIELDGEKFALPKKVRDAILRQGDYTQKTQEVAHQRKALELQDQTNRARALENQFATSVRPEIEKLTQLDAYLKQYDGLDWNSMNVEEMVRNKHQRDQLVESKQKLLSDINQKKGEWDGKVKTAKQEVLAKANELLKSSIPTWSPETAKKVSDYAVSKGFTQSEVDAIIEPRYVETLFKSMQYDDLVAKKATAKAAATAAAPMVKPGSTNPMPPQVKEKLNYRNALKKAPLNSPERKAIVENRIARLFGG